MSIYDAALWGITAGATLMVASAVYLVASMGDSHNDV